MQETVQYKLPLNAFTLFMEGRMQLPLEEVVNLAMTLAAQIAQLQQENEKLKAENQALKAKKD